MEGTSDKWVNKMFKWINKIAIQWIKKKASINSHDKEKKRGNNNNRILETQKQMN